MTKFQVGETYYTRSVASYNCVFSFTVIARTAKTVTVQSNFGEKKCRLLSGDYYTSKGIEAIRPTRSVSIFADENKPLDYNPMLID